MLEEYELKYSPRGIVYCIVLLLLSGIVSARLSPVTIKAAANFLDNTQWVGNSKFYPLQEQRKPSPCGNNTKYKVKLNFINATQNAK